MVEVLHIIPLFYTLLPPLADIYFEPNEIDQALANDKRGLEIAFARAKDWSKYCKEVLVYIQRRISADVEYAKQVQKMAESANALMGAQSEMVCE